MQEMRALVSGWCLACGLLSAAAGEGPRVDVVVAPSAPPLERRAAEEICQTLKRLYDADVRFGEAPANDAPQAIFVGSPATNPQIRAFADQWPSGNKALSDQGHLVRSAAWRDRPALLIGGGSPVATYWAAAEYAHRLGVRSLLYGDLDPVAPPPFQLTGYDVVLEPQLRLRAWRTINDFPIGPESWGLAEQQQLLRQLAKLKYNRVILSVYPWQPFVDFEFEGVHKQTGVLWYGWQYPVSGNTSGRSVFRGEKFFENPDFAGRTTYAARLEAGRALVQGLIATAHELGMSVGLATSPLEFPKEFAAVLPEAQVIAAPEPLAIGPGKRQLPDDARLMQLAKAQLRAYLATYPQLDALYLSLPEFPDWNQHAEAAWKKLAAQSAGLPSLEQLTASARQRPLTSSGDRGEKALRGNLAALEFLSRLRADAALFRRPDGRDVECVLTQIDPALFPQLDQLLPPETGALHFVDYTARRVAAQRELLAQVPAGKAPQSLILTLADDNVGVLPQLAHTSLHQLLGALRERRWSGFMTRYWCVGDLDLSAYLLSRGSFDPQLTPAQALADLLTPVCGEGVSDRVWMACELVEQATTLVDEHDIGFSFPVPNVLLKHYDATEPPPAWWGQVRDNYLNAMNEMYRANTRAREGGRSYTLYLARRYEFGFEYLNCVEAVRRAGLAHRDKDVDAEAEQLEKAVESLHGALNALAAVARSNSDRGVIAVLNEYGMRPLNKKLQELEDRQ